ncbi:Glycosyl transferase family 11 [Oleidesulfovibrio alaskensis]|jgi:hypothetical protein
MFQFAAAYALAKRMGGELRLDLSGFKKYPLRSYSLDLFTVDTPLWHGLPMSQRRFRIPMDAWTRGSRLPLVPSPPFVMAKEKNFAFSPIVYELQQSCYLYGYWQSYRYFQDVEDDIRTLFSLSRFATLELAPVVAQLNEVESVAVHLRRGDYITDAASNAVHGVCGIDYYQRSMSLVRRSTTKPIFYIFSDEPEVAKKLFATEDDVVVMPSRRQEEDLLLMSRCKHHIIANSSFSWWAAWLGKRASGLCIAPRYWFARPKLESTYLFDLIPDEWLLL